MTRTYHSKKNSVVKWATRIDRINNLLFNLEQSIFIAEKTLEAYNSLFNRYCGLSYQKARKNAIYAKIQIERTERYIAELKQIKESFMYGTFRLIGTHVEDERVAQVFELHYIKKYNKDDIAKELNIERRTVDLLLHRMYNIFTVGKKTSY